MIVASGFLINSSINAQTAIIVFLIMAIYNVLLYKDYKKLQAAKYEADTLNELRKTFIDADQSIIYLKDENFKYVAEKKIKDLSYNDQLTSLYNRRYFEEEIQNIDQEGNYPISVIVGDINGLKIVNDIFGHSSGDTLLKKAARSIKSQCRADDIAVRWGGDEYIIIFPKTTNEEAEKIASRIKEEFAKERIKVFSGSISLGCDTKSTSDIHFMQTMKNAEDKMYAQKTLDKKDFGCLIIDSIINKLHQDPTRKEHAKRVSKLSQAFFTILEKLT